MRGGGRLLVGGFVAVLLGLASAVTAPAALPVITNPPAPQTIFLGDAASFSVGASGTAPLSYQWFRNGTAIIGARTNRLVFTTAAPDNNAQFTVQVTNISGAVTSPPAALTIDFGTPGPVQTSRLLEITNPWRYHVSGTDLGTSWAALGYNDSAWSAGGGLLYVEDAALPAPKTTALPLTAGSLPRLATSARCGRTPSPTPTASVSWPTQLSTTAWFVI